MHNWNHELEMELKAGKIVAAHEFTPFYPRQNATVYTVYVFFGNA